jgi:hypothetical protein
VLDLARSQVVVPRDTLVRVSIGQPPLGIADRVQPYCRPAPVSGALVRHERIPGCEMALRNVSRMPTELRVGERGRQLVFGLPAMDEVVS